MSDLLQSLTAAVDYCRRNNVDIPLDVQLKARQFGAMKAAGNMAEIQQKYHDAITQALTTYFEGGSVTAPRNKFRQAAVVALGDAFDTGYAENGGAMPMDSDALGWLNARVEQELGYIGMLFEQAKEIRKEEKPDFFSWVTARADGYTAAVRECYNAGKMFAKRNQLLTWQYGDTDHCVTCEKLNGQKHRASWYLSRNYIPRKPGANLECGGYRCQCSLIAPDGSTFTL